MRQWFFMLWFLFIDQTKALSDRKNERETVGVDLYGIQQELARYQMMLESMHDEYSKLSQERNGLQAKLSDVRTQYRDKQFTVSDERKKGLLEFLAVFSLCAHFVYFTAKYNNELIF